MIQKKYWTYRKLDGTKVLNLSMGLGVTETISKVLLNRGIDQTAQAKKFLNASLENLYDPFLLKDMTKVARRIERAIITKEKICIYGDYDVDGIASTSILLKYFKSINHPAIYYIPNRLEEGYGLNKEAITKLAQNGTKLIITVDCGITSHEEVELSNDLGVDIIITDHHECSETLPAAYGIINPKQEGCIYPFDNICGCGIALKLIQALTPQEEFKSTIYDYLDIVTIATIADIVPLTDENRIIVKNGLEHLSESQNLGIQALLKVCGFDDKKLNVGNIAFGIAPRINAAGRISSADIGVELLTTADADNADRLAKLLNEENKLRQEVEIDILNKVIDTIESDSKFKDDKVLVIHGEGWHTGVIGIVASRIVEKYYKPTIILGIEDGVGKGSARSISGFSLFDSMSKCRDLFIKFGGHEQAAGLSMKVENIEKFRKQINLIADDMLTDEDFIQNIFYDDELELPQISDQLLNELEMIQPFGMGNPAPKFVVRDANIIEIRGIGVDKKHLKLKMKLEGNIIDGIAFGLGEFEQLAYVGDKIDVAFSPEYNSFGGKISLQLNIKDIKLKTNTNYRQHPILREYYNKINIIKNNTNTEYKDLKLNIVREEKHKLVKRQIEGVSINSRLLIVVNTLEGASELLPILENREYSTKTKLDISYNQPNNGSIITDIDVVINPYVDKIEFKRYNNIIVYDMFYSKDEFESFICQNDVDKVTFLYKDCDATFNINCLNNVIPSRVQLVAIYKQLMDNKSNRSNILSCSFSDLYEEIEEKFNLKINEALLNNALTIFAEGSLLTYEIEDCAYKIQLLKPTNKVDVNELKFTKLLHKQKDEFEKFKKIWLQLL